ncbi:hypothetical protein CNY89_29225, partial [Amaricoccus sp. HAR-UPW-R2A-40]
MGEEGPEVIEMGGSGFVTPAPQTRTYLDSLFDRTAGGGPVKRGGLYLVGEEGPEVIEMGGSGFVTPAPQTRTYLDSL